jgi:hypothetical protein
MKTGTKPTVASAKKAPKVLTKQERVVQQLLTALIDTGAMRTLAREYGLLFGDVLATFPAAAKALITDEYTTPIDRSDIDLYVAARMAALREHEQEVNARIQAERLRHHEWVEASHKHFASMHKLY